MLAEQWQKEPVWFYPGAADSQTTPIPNDVLLTVFPRLAGAQVRVYVWLCNQTIARGLQSVQVCQAEIGRAVGLSAKTVGWALERLETYGLVERERQNDYHNRYAASSYTLTLRGKARQLVDSGRAARAAAGGR